MAGLISSGLELMLAGMGIVYMFLTMLVVMINLMSEFVQRYFPEMPTRAGKGGGIDKSTVAAITAAVHQYRQHQHSGKQSR